MTIDLSIRGKPIIVQCQLCFLYYTLILNSRTFAIIYFRGIITSLPVHEAVCNY